MWVPGTLLKMLVTGRYELYDVLKSPPNTTAKKKKKERKIPQQHVWRGGFPSYFPYLPHIQNTSVFTWRQNRVDIIEFTDLFFF